MALRHVVQAYLERFLDETATDGAGVPCFIEREFRDILGCDDFRRGFCRMRCADCAFERLIPFSCRARAICPTRGGRRMAEQTAHLADRRPVAADIGRRWQMDLDSATGDCILPPWRSRKRL
jgi:hypothetical protein